jgi:L-malate glycosyltransferase
MKTILIVCHDNLLYGASKSLLDWVKSKKKYNDDIRLLFILPSKNGGLYSELQKEGFITKVIRYYQPIRKFHNNSADTKIKNITRSFLSKLFNPLAVNKIVSICKEYEVDLIHTNSFVVPIGVQAAIETNIPHVWHIREYMEEDHQFEYIYPQTLLEDYCGYSYAIFISKAIEHKYKEKYKFNQTKVIYNQIHYDGKYKRNRKFGQDSDFNLVIVGKITKTKGQERAIKAIERLVSRGYSLKLFLCGEGPDEEKLKNYVHSHGLNNYIEFMGFCKDMLSIRKDMDIALMCSEHEAFGRVTVEAMYYENLIIGLDSAGTSEIVEDGVTGLLYSDLDNEKTLERYIEFAINKPESSKQVILNSKNYAISTYSNDIYIKIVKVYNSLLQV